MFGNDTFYHETTRRYVAVFGTLFNDITITRKNNSGTEVQRMKVPISYAPMQKFLARLEGDPSLNAPAITLPRMTFEITGMTYDGERKLNSAIRNTRSVTSAASTKITQFSPTPYDIEFQLNIMTKYNEDGTKILEQILPFFKPDFNMSVKLIDDLNMYLDIAVVLNSVTTEDTYEGSFEERRALIWTLSFTLKGYYFGPTTTRKVIKFARTDLYPSLTANNLIEYVSVQPGFTSNGNPTTVLADTIDYDEIKFGDNWDYVIVVGDNDE